MQLSRFFSLTEMTRSETAAREGITNEPGSGEVERLRELCLAVLDPLREALAQAIKVNSGYRSAALNRRIGGAPTSQHVEGKATDIQVPGLSVLDLFKAMIRLELPFDQLIYEAKSATVKWVHVSHNAGANRGEIRLAQFDADGRPRAYPLVTAQKALDMTDTTARPESSPQPLEAPHPGFESVPLELEYFEVGDEPSLAPVARKRRRATRKPKATKAPGKRSAQVSPARKPIRKAAVRGARKVQVTKPARGREQSSAAASRTNTASRRRSTKARRRR